MCGVTQCAVLVNLFAVAECKTSSFTGVNGIMIRETAETFGIITQDDKFRGICLQPTHYHIVIFQCICSNTLEELLALYLFLMW